jgi:peptidoglycan hydrolase CwlO-like protein
MANSFFDKLNTLVKAQINDIISPMTDDDRTSASRRKALARQDIRGGLEKDVAELQKRVDDALAYEDDLQAKVDKLYGEIADLDREADQLIQDGREAEARQKLGRIQQLQKELEMLEADLHEHRYVTQELISQVNTLDSVVQQAKHDDATNTNPQTSSAPTGDSDKSDVERIGENISRQLDSTRQKLSDLINSYMGPQSTFTTGEPEPEQPYTPERRPRRSRTKDKPASPKPSRERKFEHAVSKDKVDKDYADRVARLSKPPKKDD